MFQSFAIPDPRFLHSMNLFRRCNEFQSHCKCLGLEWYLALFIIQFACLASPFAFSIKNQFNFLYCLFELLIPQLNLSCHYFEQVILPAFKTKFLFVSVDLHVFLLIFEFLHNEPLPFLPAPVFNELFSLAQLLQLRHKFLYLRIDLQALFQYHQVFTLVHFFYLVHLLKISSFFRVFHQTFLFLSLQPKLQGIQLHRGLQAVQFGLIE